MKAHFGSPSCSHIKSLKLTSFPVFVLWFQSGCFYYPQNFLAYLSFLIPNLALGLDYRSGFFSVVLNLGMLLWMQFTLPIWLPSLLTILGNCEAQSSLSLAALLSGCNLNTWQGRAFRAEGYGEIMEALSARVKSVNSFL